MTSIVTLPNRLSPYVSRSFIKDVIHNHHQYIKLSKYSQWIHSKKILYSIKRRNIHSFHNEHKDDEHNNYNKDNKDIHVMKMQNDIMKLSFNRPEKANAMGKSMLSQLQHIITKLTTTQEGKNVRCLILSSCSDKVFSAGADLKERSQMTMQEAGDFVSSLRSTLNDLSLLPMPMIACIEGAALGGGLEIALTADIIVAGKNATFGLPETSLAIIPGAGGTQRLPRLIGLARAKELIFTARKINADTAYEYGIVQHLVQAGDAENKSIELALSIATNGPLAVRAAKKSIMEGTHVDLVTGMQIEKSCYGSIIPTNDRLEGLKAFKEKRNPVYNGN